MSDKNLSQEIEEISAKYGFVRPDRGNLDDPAIEWREGKPNYDLVDLAFFKGRTTNHPPGSLPMIVENLVKMWELDLTHKVNKKDWESVDWSKVLSVQVNGGREVLGDELLKLGSYNWVMEEAPKSLYDAEALSFIESHRMFRGAFLDGFPWEVLEVFSGPPKVAFSWRHWGTFNGEYKERKGNGEVVELYGFSVATVTEDLKITNVQTYTKFEGFLQVLNGVASPEEIKNPFSAGCPIYKEEDI